MTILKSVLLFALAAAAEISGAWLIWQAVREDRAGGGPDSASWPWGSTDLLLRSSRCQFRPGPGCLRRRIHRGLVGLGRDPGQLQARSLGPYRRRRVPRGVAVDHVRAPTGLTAVHPPTTKPSARLGRNGANRADGSMVFKLRDCNRDYDAGPEPTLAASVSGTAASSRAAFRVALAVTPYADADHDGGQADRQQERLPGGIQDHHADDAARRCCRWPPTSGRGTATSSAAGPWLRPPSGGAGPAATRR